MIFKLDRMTCTFKLLLIRPRTNTIFHSLEPFKTCKGESGQVVKLATITTLATTQ